MSLGSKLQLEPGSWAEMFYDVIIGIAVGASHSTKLVLRTIYEGLILPVIQAFGLKEEEESKLEKTLKVVAVGYGRTGTVSPGPSLHDARRSISSELLRFRGVENLKSMILNTIFLECISLHFYYPIFLEMLFSIVFLDVGFVRAWVPYSAYAASLRQPRHY